MILKNSDYASVARDVKEHSKKIIIYGAGMIGQIVVPYLIKEYDLYDNIECFVDMDQRKKGQKVVVGERWYEITTPDYLESIDWNHIILITNSKCFPVIKFLDEMKNLDEIEGYIVPLMQIYELERSKSIAIEEACDRQLIPQKIHYCWFGGKELPAFLKSCILSWQKHCPSYELLEWNESNYDVNRHAFTKEAYENGKYGFVTDVARLDILYEHGGIYLDTDVTLVKNLDKLLYQPAFVGTEKWGNINTGGGCGFIAGHPTLEKMIEYRKKFHFLLEDGSFNIETNGMYETRPFLEMGFKPDNTLQEIGGVTVYPSYINHPYDYMSCEMHQKETTVSVHHFFGGWMEEEDRLNRKKTQNEYEAIVKRVSK